VKCGPRLLFGQKSTPALLEMLEVLTNPTPKSGHLFENGRKTPKSSHLFGGKNSNGHLAMV
jgi:hypothetical protein